jgi:hypothetical protein
MKDKNTLLSWLLMILLIALISCFNKKENEKSLKAADTYNWTAAISSPKFYPIGNVTVDFGYASANVLTSFDSGWGDTSGNFISGKKYKPAPKKVYIKYTCGANNFVYEGTLKLPKENRRPDVYVYCR